MTRRRSAARKGKHAKAPARKLVTAAQFKDARIFSGLTRDDAAELLGVSLRTIGHWETGKARPAWAAFKLLRVYRHGELPDPAWAGYRLVRGKLVTPEDRWFEPHDLAWLSLLVRRGRALTDLLKHRDAAPALGAPATNAGTAACALRAFVQQSLDAIASRPLPIAAAYRATEYVPTPVGVNSPDRFNGSIGPCSNTGQNSRVLPATAQPDRSVYAFGGAA